MSEIEINVRKVEDNIFRKGKYNELRQKLSSLGKKEMLEVKGVNVGIVQRIVHMGDFKGQFATASKDGAVYIKRREQ